MWDFETDADFQQQLDWADSFVRDVVEPLDFVLGNPYDKSDERSLAVVRPLQEEVRRRGLWACHLGPDLGGQGYGQVKLALLNEILGRSRWAPSVFGCQAPDSGNAEILAHYGTEEQKSKYLKPLLDGEITSCYSMTEPHAGADPTLFKVRAERDGADWVINGEKWFSSNARHASFFLVMAVTDPQVSPYEGMSMFIVPAETPGIDIVRNIGVATEPPGQVSAAGVREDHGYVRYENVRVPADHLLGAQGQGFVIAQTRLGGGRIHHAMRTVAMARHAFDLMCERAVSRRTKRGPLAALQLTQEKVADSWIDIESFRLLVLRTAWLIDKHQDYKKVRKDIAAVKVMLPRVLHDVAQRALHLHGALGVSNEMPFMSMMVTAEALGIADGPTEVHKITLARQVLDQYAPVDTLFPSGHLPSMRERALAAFAERVDHEATQF
ncbi:acyl-CoA dehydrogenase family protein [Streptomyces sp. NPDC097610]|uniref:acyl-CoA dehydrogenase family protein n=1 Tax=Streptomyces sp. NPDC097610 TaxID=3157227 RepID=UPI0033172C57